MSNSCKKIKSELVKCIYASDCFNVNGKTFGECLRSENQYELSEYCLNLKHTYFECKRGQLDMRNRFKGNHWEPPAQNS